MVGTRRPAALCASSTRSVIRICSPQSHHDASKESVAVLWALHQSHHPGAIDKLQSAIHNRWINHLRTEAHHSQAFLLCLFVSRDNLLRFFDLRLRWRERFMNNRNLRRVDTSHPFKTQGAGSFAPMFQPFHVANV